MTASDFLPLNEINLTNCDREPIHIPGAIQPHGVLLVLSEPELLIQQVSDNTEALLGLAPDAVLGTSVMDWFTGSQLDGLGTELDGEFEQLNPLTLVRRDDSAQRFDGIVHRSVQGDLILELEPAIANLSNTFFDFYKLTKGSLAQMQRAGTLAELCQIIVREVRRLTGFDRVMVYQFDATGAGNVIAEDKAEGLDTYLGLHYPDSDIPKQAKRLYTLNGLRLIPDVDYQAVAIRAAATEPAVEREPLDLSLSVLRSVSPIHIEYLKNMGVGASMSISLINNQRLWGLIACHHLTPRFVPYTIRTACEFLGQVMSLELVAKEENDALDQKMRLKTIQSQFIDVISRADEFTDALVCDRAQLLNLVNAEGAAIYADGHLTLVGKTPSDAQLHDLIVWLDDKFDDQVFVTDALPTLYSPAMEFKAIASGLLALSITRIQKHYILWFRPELLQQINWAGNPDKPKRIEADGSLTLFPRQSFELWQETVRLRSLPWRAWEVEGAIELRSAIVGIILRRADELAAINLELERSNNELDAFAYIASHDLKEPLRGIHNYSTFLLEDYGDVLDQDGVAKLETLVRLTKRMEDLINSLLHFSRLGRQELDLEPIDLNRLVHSVSDVIHMSQRHVNLNIQMPRPLPDIRGDRVLVEEVFINLIGNGVKYNDQPEKVIEIGFLDAPSHAPADPSDQPSFWTFYVRDNGIGICDKHLDTIFRIFKRLHAPGKYGGGTGAGLTIVRKIIERHGGMIWVESVYGNGSTFYFTLPA